MTKSFFTFVLFLFFATALSAQDSDAMVSSITTFNNTVNADIANEKLFSHRITLNTESSKVKFWGKMNKYTENATCLSGFNRFTIEKQIPSGVYLVQVTVGNEIYTAKIVK